MKSFRDTLVDSAAELGYGSDAFRALENAETVEVSASVERVFGDAANGAMVGWWHSDLNCPMSKASECFHDGGWKHLIAVAPHSASPVWLLAENWPGGSPPLVVFESTASVVQAVLGNMHAFEYIVCGRRLDWLFSEDHHNCVSVAGSEAVERLRQVAELNRQSG